MFNLNWSDIRYSIYIPCVILGVLTAHVWISNIEFPTIPNFFEQIYIPKWLALSFIKFAFGCAAFGTFFYICAMLPFFTVTRGIFLGTSETGGQYLTISNTGNKNQYTIQEERPNLTLAPIGKARTFVLTHDFQAVRGEPFQRPVLTSVVYYLTLVSITYFLLIFAILIAKVNKDGPFGEEESIIEFLKIALQDKIRPCLILGFGMFLLLLISFIIKSLRGASILKNNRVESINTFSSFQPGSMITGKIRALGSVLQSRNRDSRSVNFEYNSAYPDDWLGSTADEPFMNSNRVLITQHFWIVEINEIGLETFWVNIPLPANLDGQSLQKAKDMTEDQIPRSFKINSNLSLSLVGN